MYGWLLAAAVVFAGYVIIRKTKTFWIKVLFPVGYYLYNTRLGYKLHLYRLSKRSSSPHSITQPLSLSGFTVIPLAVLSDNYAYVVVDDTSKCAVVVDPSDPDAVKKCVQERNLTLKAILTTHKHWDHSGGNEVLKRDFRDLTIYGGAKDNVPCVTDLVQDKDIIKIGKLTFEAIWTPGHTVGHIVYVLQSSPLCVFTGDHLFVGGTGRLFECDAKTMLRSIKKITELPENSLLFPGHEYTWLNVKFIDSLQTHLVSPPALKHSRTEAKNKLHWVSQQRASKLATIPAILSEELRYSPYLQCERPTVRDLVGLSQQAGEDQVLAELRERKNAYKPYN